MLREQLSHRGTLLLGDAVFLAFNSDEGGELLPI